MRSLQDLQEKIEAIRRDLFNINDIKAEVDYKELGIDDGSASRCVC